MPLVLQGDFLVHFMDIAREELTKKPEEISVEKLQVPLVLCSLFISCYGENWFLAALVMIIDKRTLPYYVYSLFTHYVRQSLVDIALRSTAAASDPSHEDLTCCVVSLSYLSLLNLYCTCWSPYFTIILWNRKEVPYLKSWQPWKTWTVLTLQTSLLQLMLISPWH